MYSLQIFFIFLICLILMILFFLIGSMEKWDLMSGSSFECGFSSYFGSRFSFSIHYMLVGLIFLFLDLELCLLMPLFLDFYSNFHLSELVLFILIVLILGLVKEWNDGKLDWCF